MNKNFLINDFINNAMFFVYPARLKTISLPAISEFFPRMVFNNDHDSLFVLHSGVYKLDIDATSFPAKPLIDLTGKKTYGLDLDPANGDIYVSDVKDYLQKSDIWIYNAQGKLKSGPLKAGIIASQFLFLR